mmetsp:Transcript_66565/g.192185  ORF Transcript_66565/g.192185 Transcript_66565/m.192185 type:complete len:557 (+) Transcript_66565:68-1738(+)
MAPPSRCGVIAALAALQSLVCVAAGMKVQGCPKGWKAGMFTPVTQLDRHSFFGASNALDCEKYFLVGETARADCDIIAYSRYKTQCICFARHSDTHFTPLGDGDTGSFWESCEVGEVDAEQFGQSLNGLLLNTEHPDSWWQERHCKKGWVEGAWGAESADCAIHLISKVENRDDCLKWAMDSEYMYQYEYLQFEQWGARCCTKMSHGDDGHPTWVNERGYSAPGSPGAKAWRCQMVPGPDPNAKPTRAPFHWPHDCGVKTCSGGWKDGAVSTDRVLGHIRNLTSEADCLEKGLQNFPEGQYVVFWRLTSGTSNCIVKQQEVGTEPHVIKSDVLPPGIAIVVKYCAVQCQPTAVGVASETPAPTSMSTPAPTPAPMPCKRKGWYCDHLCEILGKGPSCKATCEEHISEVKGGLKAYCEGSGAAVLAEAGDVQAAVAEEAGSATEEASLLQAVAPEALVAHRHDGSDKELMHYCTVLCAAIKKSHTCAHAHPHHKACCGKRCALSWHSHLKPMVDTLCRSGICPPEEPEMFHPRPSFAEVEAEPTSLLQNPIAGFAEL